MSESAAPKAAPVALWVERLVLRGFRNHAATEIAASPAPQVLFGANGSGKTNILEALSLLAPGQGLRRSAFADLAQAGGDGTWSVAARVATALGPVDIGTGIAAATGGERSGRIVRIDGVTKSGSGALADYIEMVWVTPATDGLFSGPGSDRRRFLDRFVLCSDPGHAGRVSRYEKAMASRNRLLSDGVRDNTRLEGLELIMAETGVAIAASRARVVDELSAVVAARRDRDPGSPFPWSTLALDGFLETGIGAGPALDTEDRYQRLLAAGRERDRAAGRTLEGPHRADLSVGHGPKGMPAKLCSTGEQKALLLGLVLAHAEMVRRARDGAAPILLLDEIAAHLDAARRAALFAELLTLGTQAWMTGTDRQLFSYLEGRGRFWAVSEGRVEDAGASL